jgi:hypothetical protein
VGEPGHPDPVSDTEAGTVGTELVDDADYLMARDDAGMLGNEVAFGQVQIGTTHPAYRDAYSNLARSGFGNVPLHAHQGAGIDGPGLVDDPGLH